MLSPIVLFERMQNECQLIFQNQCCDLQSVVKRQCAECYFASLPQTWFTWQRPLNDQKTKVRLIMRNHISTIPENLVKIGVVHPEIIGLQGDL